MLQWKILWFCEDLGIMINWEKLDLKPRQMSKYLGMLMDVDLEGVFLTDSRISKFKVIEVAEHFLSLLLRQLELIGADSHVNVSEIRAFFPALNGFYRLHSRTLTGVDDVTTRPRLFM